MTDERTFGLDRSRIARFRSLPPSDRSLFLIALLAIASVRVGMWLTSFRRLHRSLARIERPNGSPDPTPGEVDRIASSRARPACRRRWPPRRSFVAGDTRRICGSA